MLAVLRQLARPIGLALVLLSCIPVQAIPCAEAATGEVMPCCLASADAASTLDAECCTVREQSPVPDPGPAVPGTSGSTAAMPSSGTVVAGTPVPPSDRFPLASPREPGQALDRLYLRLSNIRR